MGLFNLKSIFESEHNEKISSNLSFTNPHVEDIRFVDEMFKISNNLKSSYREANLNYHKNAIKTGKIKRSDMYTAIVEALLIAENYTKDLYTKTEKQFKRNHKEYDITESLLIKEPITVYGKNFSVPESNHVNITESLINIVNGNKEYIMESYNNRSFNNKKERSILRESFGSEFVNVPESFDDMATYMNESYFNNTSDKCIVSRQYQIYNSINRNNKLSLLENIKEDFDNVLEDLCIARTSIDSLIDNEIKSESIPYNNPEDQNDIDVKGNCVIYSTSQFIENACEKLISIGYKTELLYEFYMQDKKICELAKKHVDNLKESGYITDADIILAEVELEDDWT